MTAVDGSTVRVEHVDVQCDGCEADPILGDRFKCSVCSDRDLCATCMRGLVKARVLRARQVDARSEVGGGCDRGVTTRRDDQQQQQRWSGRLYAELEQAVPCLDPSHRFVKMEGPERAVRLMGGPAVAASLPHFLSTFSPSLASCADLAWIAVDRDEHAGQVDSQDRSSRNPLKRRVERLLWEWEAVLDEGGQPIHAEDLDRLARAHAILRGKWMLFPSVAEVDTCWAAVAKGVVAGSLGPTAKVSSVSPLKENHVVLVTVQNYLDTEEVRRIEDVLRSAVGGLRDDRMLLKPDVYSILCVNAKNEWGLRPTIREARLRAQSTEP